MAGAAVHLDAGAHDSGPRSGSPRARRSLQLLWWIPLSPIVGFLLASLVLADSWPLWQVVPLALTLAAPFVVGALYGYATIKHGDRTGWVGLLIHLAMVIVAIVLPISESVSR